MLARVDSFTTVTEAPVSTSMTISLPSMLTVVWSGETAGPDTGYKEYS